ncbi:hypothetical protein ALC56_00322 [Trachymyrmex septentrionalis]|uniref:DUF5641 domain-containing protein n=1 Tax=Trachymyrmex septentrionalis TaxID=34720 RepID=A0A151K1X8_9HYME|nr:hypothetical protein ALC56_00322 [Trachymyrmex septentrionalis]
MSDLSSTRRSVSRIIDPWRGAWRVQQDRDFREHYEAFMREYLTHMSPAAPPPASDDRRLCYLPYHGVLKGPSGAAKIRVVFNGLACTPMATFLNDNLLVESNLLPALKNIVTRWRRHRFVITTLHLWTDSTVTLCWIDGGPFLWAYADEWPVDTCETKDQNLPERRPRYLVVEALRKPEELQCFSYRDMEKMMINKCPLSEINDARDHWIRVTQSIAFRLEMTLVAIPKPSLVTILANRFMRWRLLHTVLWQKWAQKYLQTLIPRPKWWQQRGSMKEGQLCLLRSENTPPTHWPLASCGFTRWTTVMHDVCPDFFRRTASASGSRPSRVFH